jgi:hypothetical protein
MKKTVQIVTIPLNKEGWSKRDLVKTIYNDAFFEIAVYDNCLSSEGTGYQFLVLSDDELHNNEVYYDTILKAWGRTPYMGETTDVCKKVIASYPQLEGTLPISKETVQAWIDAGTPLEVTLKEALRGSMCLDPQGDLLLEFGEKIELKEIGEKLKDRILFPDALEHAKDYLSKVVKPSIPTDKEIEKKAEQSATEWWASQPDPGLDALFTEELEKWAKQDYCCGYEDGYKQALKDLGYADN